MLLRKALIIGVVSIAGLFTTYGRANAGGIVVTIAVRRPTARPSISANDSDALVRIRLVEKLPKNQSAASVSMPAGSNKAFVIEVKRSALSTQVLAAAFDARLALAARRLKYPNANIVVYLPENFSPRRLSPSDDLKFGRLVAELKAHPPGDFIEASGD